MSALVPRERIEQTIFLIRGHRVMLSTNLADLYAVEPRVRIQAVKHNRDRFPADFMFQLTEQEFDHLIFILSPSTLVSSHSRIVDRSDNLVLVKV